MDLRAVATAIFFVVAAGTMLSQPSITTTTATGSNVATVSITEPSTSSLETLFNEADIVALVHVVSGDAESYRTVMYKAEVLNAYKGSVDGQVIYFGPFSGTRIGRDYVEFLRTVEMVATPIREHSYGAVRYGEVLNQGYGAMDSSYACVFPGRIPDQSCDYAIRICTDYVKLPKNVPSAPPEKSDPPFGCRWVRKQVFMSLLDHMKQQVGAH
jgi:hypothetical protein